MRKKMNNGGGFRNNNGGGSNNRSRNKFRSGGGGGQSGGGQNDAQSLARQKKHAQTQREKYTNMARDAMSNGDRVEAEYYFQHVEHYTRVLGEIAEREPQPREQTHQQDDADEFEANGEAGDEQQAAPRQQHRQREDRRDERDERDADEQPQERAPRNNPRRQRPQPQRAQANAQDDDEIIPLPSSILSPADDDDRAAG